MEGMKLYDLVEVSAIVTGVLFILSLYTGVIAVKGFEISSAARYLHTTILTPLLAIAVYIHSLGGMHLMLKKRKMEHLIIPVTVIYTLIYVGFFVLFFLPPQYTTVSTFSSIPIESNLLLSPEEIAKHSSPDDCWIIVEGKVYDVTAYLNLHPGGRDVILPYCGKDATSAFVGKPHSQAAYNLLQSFYIGDVNGIQVAKPSNPVKDIENLIKERYGDVNILYIKPEEGGYEAYVEINGRPVEVKIVNGEILYEESEWWELE